MHESLRGSEIATLLWDANAIHIGRAQPFILAAGWASPVYVDCRRLIDAPAHRQKVTEIAVQYISQRLQGVSFDAIVGTETAGLPFAAWIADALSMRLRYVRKRPLGIGCNSQVEGGDVAGLNVLIMDDQTTDARGKVAFARGLRTAGARVQHVLTIFYHDAFPGANERLEQADLKLHTLTRWTNILETSVGRLDASDRKLIENFLSDPVDWSGRNGGRTA